MSDSFRCAHCRKRAERPAGHVNRSRRIGMALYCSRRCSGLARRDGKTKAQRVEEKRIYDAAYRKRNRALLKRKKAAYFRATYDPDKARIERKKRAKQHAEYCRRPAYKRWKRQYDARYRAKEYGEFADAYRVLLEVNREVRKRIDSYESKRQQGTFGKTQARRREDGKAGRDGY